MKGLTDMRVKALECQGKRVALRRGRGRTIYKARGRIMKGVRDRRVKADDC